MKWYNDPVWVARTPIISVALLEFANVQQLWRMWTEHSALGQSVGAWITVNIALWLWVHFYRVMTPGAKWAIRGTMLGIGMNTMVILTVLWFRWGVRLFQ